MSLALSTYLFYYFISYSILRFFLVIIFWNFHPKHKGERRVRFIVNSGIILDIIHVSLTILFFKSLVPVTVIDFMFYSVDFVAQWTVTSVAFLSFATLVLCLVARFSLFYLHRDSYYYKFFSLLYILQLAIFLLILTNGSESVFIGWEFLGLSSILLIAFYDHRTTVLKNSLLILVLYKCSDILFYSALIFSAYKGLESYIYIDNSYVIFSILIACLMKSSLFPWVWLPRAMEGPTPSSAVFYGGLATHIPVYIFLNVWMHTNTHSTSLILISIALILTSSVITSFLSRFCPDAKNSISYSVITQLGIIYIEIILGWYTLATIHCIVHGVYRSFEFLRSPSLLHHRHNIEKSRKKIIEPRGVHIERLLPIKIREKMYRFAYHDFILPRALLYAVECFLGFKDSRMTTSAIKAYIFIALSIFILVETVFIILLGQGVSILDESLFLLSFGFSIIALFYKHQPVRFFIAITFSVALIFNLLIAHIQSAFAWLDWIYLFVFLTLVLDLVFNSKKINQLGNEQGALAKSNVTNFIVLLVGLSVIGMPGLGSFLIWERIEHILLFSMPNLLINAFVILALNTIVFFRFYYANFLGRHRTDEQYRSVSRE